MSSPRNLTGTVLEDTCRLKKVIGHGRMVSVRRQVPSEAPLSGEL